MAARAVSSAIAPSGLSAWRTTGDCAYPTIATWSDAAKRPLTSRLQRERGHRDAGREVLERDDDARADRERRVGTVEETADGAEVGLFLELDVDEHERHEVVEAGDERLVHHRPRPHDAAPADRHEGEVGLGAVAVRADDVGRMANVSQREHRAIASTCSAAASQYPCERSSGTGTGRPVGRPSGGGAHGIAPAACSAAMSSHV